MPRSFWHGPDPQTRAVAVGGILKRYIREQGREDLTQEPGEEEPETKAEQVFFGWKREVKRYRRVNKGKS